MKITEKDILIFDGACGSNLQNQILPSGVWGENHKYEGCHEYLNLSAPSCVKDLHVSFLKAGADVVETNTFGANRIVLGEYGLENEVEAINIAAVKTARQATAEFKNRFIAGSMGPTTKLPSLGHIKVEKLYQSCLEQANALVEAGVSMLIIETCQDLLQVKTAVIAAFDAMEKQKRKIPLSVSVTMEQTGTMLVGSDIGAIVTALEPFDLFSLGLNCATGPKQMSGYISYLHKNSSKRISVIPNAGMPVVKDDKTIYPLNPEDLSGYLKKFVIDYGVSIVGGCCGTTVKHIAELVKTLENIKPKKRNVTRISAYSSLYKSVDAVQEIPPLLIGERMNVNGSAKFKKLLLSDDFKSATLLGKKQENGGAHLLDLSTAYAGRDEKDDMLAMLKEVNDTLQAPIVIDSTNVDVIKSTLEIYAGRALVNSINLENEDRFDEICKLVKRHGAAVIALAIDSGGMARTVKDKVAVAEKIYDKAVNKHNLNPCDLMFDMLTFTIGSGDSSLYDAAKNTLAAIKEIKQKLPLVSTVLGVSNISFGLPPKARKILNSVFLREAVKAGLDVAIIDASKILSLNSIDNKDRQLCLSMIYNNPGQSKEDRLNLFIDRHKDKENKKRQKKDENAKVFYEYEIEQKVISGDLTQLEDLLHILMQRYKPVEIVNDMLIPAMGKVGRLFGSGEMLLPFVLKSARVMKHSVDILEPFMQKDEKAEDCKILLATVQGDVHDIGKNLVDIILTNNGFTVLNIGTNIPIEKIIDSAKENSVSAVGLSGLLVKSAIWMKDNLSKFTQAGLDIPVLLGGAALTRSFVAKSCVKEHSGPVIYCRDAFEGLKAMSQVEKKTVVSTFMPSTAEQSKKDDLKTIGEPLDMNSPVHEPPFWGKRIERNIPFEKVIAQMNMQALFRSRWGYKKKKMSDEEYTDMVEKTIMPEFERIARMAVTQKLVGLKAIYGFYPCYSHKNSLFVEDNNEKIVFEFPRQKIAPYRCIADYFKPESEKRDVVCFMVVSVGDGLLKKSMEFYKEDNYLDYMLTHGFAMQLAEALTEYWHKEIFVKMKFPDKKTSAALGISGARYGFGYPSCPDLSAQKDVFKLLQPEKEGITLTENMLIVPEASTSAIITFHRQARYFAV